MNCATALLLMLDVSGSINPEAFALQRDGHAAAFRSPAVVRSIARDGLAVAVMQWHSAQHVALGWRVLSSAADAEQMARDVEAMPRHGAGSTHTGAAITAGLALLETAPCGDQATLDIVTDGPGDGPVTEARDAAVAAGVRINGLGVRTAFAAFGDPVEWLRENVATPGGFVLEANGWGQFADAVRRKLSTEVGALQ